MAATRTRAPFGITSEDGLRFGSPPLRLGPRHVALALASVLAGTATILAGIGLIATSGYLISRAAQRPPILDLMLVFVAVRFFGLARPALRYAERLVSHDLTFRILYLVRGWFVAALVPLSPGQLAGYRSGDLLSRVASDVDTLQDAWLRTVAPVTIALLTVMVVVGGLSIVDVRIAIVVLALLLFNGAVWTSVALRLARGLGTMRNTHRRAMSADLVMVAQGLEDVLAFGYEDTALARIEARQRKLDAVENRYGWRQALHAAVASAVTYLAFVAALGLSLTAASTGDLPFVWIAAIALAVVASFEAVDSLPAAWQFAGQTLDSARRVREVVATQPAVAERRASASRRPAVAQGLQDRLPPSLEFRNVTFTYGTRLALRSVSFDVAAAEHVGIIGPTGSGKSTLLSMVMRWWDPTTGRILMGGENLRDIPLTELRARIAVWPQQIHVFNATLRDNLGLARPAASDQELLGALERAQLGEFVRRLPRGLETMLGEFGARMSAGERQRLGFARILLTDAPLLLVDEPTAHLDVECEQAVLRELNAWATGRTLLLVSHRPAALMFVDRVLEMRDAAVSAPSV